MEQLTVVIVFGGGKLWSMTTMNKRHYFHLCSDGSLSRSFILSNKDFISAINIIALCAANTSVSVLAFALEDTHPHFLLYGTFEECFAFKKLFESIYIRYAANTREGGADLILDIEMYPADGDLRQLRTVAAYVIYQPTKDGKQVMPFDYLWGSGSMYFRSGHCILPWLIKENGTLAEPVTFASLTVDEKRAVCHSRKYDFPDSWLVANGIVLPTNYIDVARFENIFQTANCYRVFLAGSSKRDEDIAMETARARGVTLEDAQARMLCSDTCKALFGIRDVRRLSTTDRIDLARKLKRAHNMTARQLASVVRLPEGEIRRFAL